MESSERSQEILSLGNKLVEELKLADSNDTLSRWMAHYLAELMTQAESATGEAKANLEKQCFETILKIWANRGITPEEPGTRIVFIRKSSVRVRRGLAPIL
jgi:hypothetical protein